VTVTATPQEFEDEGAALLSKYSQKVTVTREAGLAALKRLIDASGFDVLVSGDTWTPEYDRIAIEEQKPGPEVAFEALAKP